MIEVLTDSKVVILSDDDDNDSNNDDGSGLMLEVAICNHTSVINH